MVNRAWGIRMVTRHCYFVPVLRTVLGRVFDLSSFPPPDQYLFPPRSCYHSLMNTASIPISSPNCSQPSAFNRPCPRVRESALVAPLCPEFTPTLFVGVPSVFYPFFEPPTSNLKPPILIGTQNRVKKC